MTDKAEAPPSASEVDKQLKAELQRFKELQQNNLPALAKLLDSYEKANERLTAAGLKLSADIKRLGDKGDNQWGKRRLGFVMIVFDSFLVFGALFVSLGIYWNLSLLSCSPSVDSNWRAASDY